MQDEVLAAAEADIAAELSDHGASAETVLEFPGEDSERDGTLHEEPEPEPSRNRDWNRSRNVDWPRNQNPNRPEPAEQELTSSYDHLWERTVMRNIEDAAVREDPDADAEPSVGPASVESAVESAGDGPPAPSPPLNPPAPSRYPGPLQRTGQRQTERKPQPLLLLRRNRPRRRARRYPPD